MTLLGFHLARVEGTSLEPALRAGDVVLARRSRRARRGSLVLVREGERLLVKRVAATEGRIVRLGVETPYGWRARASVVARVVAAWRPGRGLLSLAGGAR